MSAITFIGVGRLGLCTALLYERAGYNVLGVDLRTDYCTALNNKTFVSPEPRVNEYLRESKHFSATTDVLQGCRHSDWIYVLVDTPNGEEQPYDHKNIESVLRSIKGHIRGKVVVICATVLPGFCSSIAHQLQTEEGAELCYHPEFIAQGNVIAGLEQPDVVLIGASEKHIGEALAKHATNVVSNSPQVHCMDLLSSEITKLALNCYVTMKISYANMIGDLAHETGANADSILAAVGSDSRVGGKYLRAGYGFGGPCFPRDNRALAYFAEQTAVQPLLPRATDAYNTLHAQLMANHLFAQGESPFFFKDVCYKEKCTVPIIEESQKLVVASLLVCKGAKVFIEDRKEIIDLVEKEYGDRFEYIFTNVE